MKNTYIKNSIRLTLATVGAHVAGQAVTEAVRLAAPGTVLALARLAAPASECPGRARRLAVVAVETRRARATPGDWLALPVVQALTLPMAVGAVGAARARWKVHVNFEFSCYKRSTEIISALSVHLRHHSSH